MSLVIKDLTKKYAQQLAVNHISFTAKKGEILGFLGPNGAGKSTTMKIATCYLPPTAGTVTVCDYDVQTHPLEVRQKIGYLPEHNPLYLDMYVPEYLQFMGKLYGLRGQHLQQRTKDMIDLCGLEREQHKVLGALSKGYRQRVGLAQAFIHDPEVLILDEPTTGLDPNQILEIRQVIKQISKDKTVVFSTHIMQEVKALCDRVVIINLGQIVADKPIQELALQDEQRIIVEVATTITEIALSALQGLAEELVIELIDLQKVRIRATQATDIRPLISQWAMQQQLPLIEMRKEETTLEKVFYELTR
jgi:ABC-2 type transport system ATP-binding protein